MADPTDVIARVPALPTEADWADVDFKAEERKQKTMPAAEADGETWGFENVSPNTENPTPAFDLKTQIDHMVEPAIKDFNRHYSNGQKSVYNGLLYADVLKGTKTLAQARTQQQAADDTPDLSPYAGVLGPLAETLPGLTQMGKDYMTGFAASAPAGAGYGATFGIAAAAPTGEIAAPVTGPAGAAAGAIAAGNFGGQVLALKSGGEIAAGNIFKDLVDSGVPEEKARGYAISGGLAITVMQRFGFGEAGKQIMKNAGKETVGQFVKEYFKSSGVNLANIEAQNIATQLAETLGKLNNGVAVSQKDIQDTFVKGLMQAIPLALGMSAGTKALSSVAGKMKGKSGEAEVAPEPVVDGNDPAQVISTLEKILNKKPLPPNAKPAPLQGNVSTTVHAEVVKPKAPRDRIEALAVKIDQIKDGISEAELHGTPEEVAALKEDLANTYDKKRDAVAAKKAEDLAELKREHAQAAKQKTAAYEDAKGIERRLRKAEVDGKDTKPIQEKLDAKLEEARFLNEVEATTKAKIEKIEKAALKKGVERLQNELERSKPKDGKSRFDPESNTQETLGTYRKYLNNKKAAQDAIDLYEAERVNPESASTPEGIDNMRADAEIAEDILALSDGPSYERLAKRVQEITNGALSDRKTQLAVRRAADEALHGELVEAAQGDKPIQVSETGRVVPLANKPVHPFAQFVKRFGGVSFADKMKAVTQDNPRLRPIVGKIDKLLGDAVDAVQAGKEQQLDVLMGHLTDASGLGETEVLKLINDGNQPLGTKKNPIIHTNAEGVTGPWYGTVNQALDVLGRMQDKSESVQKGITEGNLYTLGDVPGTTEYALREAVGNVSPQYFKLLDGLLNFYKEYGVRFAKAHKKAFGTTLKLEENYSGPVSREGANQHIAEKFNATIKPLVKAARHLVGKSGSSIEKVGSSLPIRPENPFFNAVKHINRSEHFINLYDVSRTFNTVFKNGSVLEAVITQKYGASAWDGINVHLDAVLNQSGRTQDAWIDTMDAVTRNAGTAMLGLKPQAILKQASGIVNFALELPADKLISGSADFWANAKENTATLMRSPVLQRRYGDFVDTQIGVGTQKTLGATQVSKFNDWALTPIKLGDKAASLPGAWAAYKHFQTPEGGGLSPAAALEKAAMLAERTQSSSRPDLTSNFSRNPYLRAIGMNQFTQPQQQLLGYEVGAWRQAMNYPTMPNLAAAMKASAITRASQAAFVAVDAAIINIFYNYGMAEKSEVDNAWWSVARAVALGNPVPVAGTIITGTAIAAQNEISKPLHRANPSIPVSHERVFSSSILSLNALDNAAKLGKDAIGVVASGQLTTKDALNIGLHWARSGNMALPPQYGGGLPVEYPLKILKRIMGKREQELITMPWAGMSEDEDGGEGE